MKAFSEHDHPHIDYPGPWEYTIFGVSEERMRAAVAGVVDGLEHTLSPSRRSRTGKFVSMHLEVIVADDPQRLRIGEELAAHADIGFVF